MERIRSLEKGATEFHWSSILAGTFVGLGVWLALYALGAAIGASGGNTRAALTTWTGIYTLVAPIIGLFFGGVVAGRGAKVMTKSDGAWHGIVVWGFASLIGTFLLGSIAAGMAAAGPGAAAGVPVGFTWAIFIAYVASFLAAMVGGALTAGGHESRELGGYRQEARKDVTGSSKGEVYP